MVGSAGAVNADLLQRMYREGHDIGNHTFTHLNSAETSHEHIKFELNATQRLLEATIGVRTRLFRPPYAIDLEPQTIDAAEALRVAGVARLPDHRHEHRSQGLAPAATPTRLSKTRRGRT